jgi:alanyl-tRNA synthetase
MSDLSEEYRLEYFEEEGFTRLECSECDDHFWTLDPDRETCGEPPCADYGFIDDPGFAEELTLEEARERFCSFFADRGHGRVDPYPVAANRWRDDVLLTQASIYDFQPHVTSGDSPPPANPLVVSQPCIRMQDIDNVGKTGRHTMAFEMGGHHAFNAEEGSEYAYEGEVYWKEECVEYCMDLLSDVGADLEDVTLIEDPWVGGGNAGPAFEVIYRGLELATLVFMQFEADPDGDYEMKDGNTYSRMDRRVIDTGYGIERWAWMSQGTPTIYEAIYPEMIETLTGMAGISHTEAEADLLHRASKLAGHMDIDEAEDMESARETIAAELDVSATRLAELMEPMEDVYAIADHCRTLAYMLGDGIVPSNVGTGYLARMVLRRTKRLCDGLGIDTPLDELVDVQADRLGYADRDTIREMVRTEVEKYAETLERGTRKVRGIASEYAERGEAIPAEELIELYDSHGIQPGTVEEIAAEFDAEVDRPEEFYALVAERHEETREGNAEPGGRSIADTIEGLPETERLYYEDQERTEFEAMVLEVFEREEGYDVVLDGTMFYPEGGGQPPDHGTLSSDERTVEVTDVQRVNGVILHRCDGDPGTGEFVRGQIDGGRRRRLMQHHTATHVIGHAAREVLGDHVRQAGARKGTDSARLDVRHYRRISRADQREIERVANEVVTANVAVSQEWPERHEAEAQHGFDIYQGGIPPGERIRLIQVEEDVQACGGTHVSRTGDVGTIKIVDTEPIQDGVERITFAAGPAAIEHVQEMEDALLDAADTFDVAVEAVPETAERFFEEWKERGKRIDDLTEQLAAARAGGSEAGEEIDLDGTTAVVRRIDAGMDELRATANAIVEEGKVAVLGSGTDGARFVVGVPEGVDVDAGEVVSDLAATVGGGGGGPPDFAQGGGPDADRLEEALDSVPDLLARTRDA